jgi:hypothetical protein
MRRAARSIVCGIGLVAAGCVNEPSHHAPMVEEGDPPTTIVLPGFGDEGDSLFPGGPGEDDGCPAGCVTGVVTPFEGLSMYQFGTPDTLGPCPDWAKTPGFEGVADMQVDPYACPACECSPAACVLPSEGMFASDAKCGGDGAVSTPFGPEGGGWEGTCNESNAIPAGLSCGEVACVQSLSVPAMVVEDCKPFAVGDAPPPQPPIWGKAVRECLIGTLPSEGCAIGEVCPPDVPPGFQLCMFMKGDDPAFTCPAAYSHREVFYAGADDQRECEACTCGAPEEPQCTALVEAFSDAACGTPAGSVMVSADEAACVDILSGSALGSVEAWMVIDKPGSCAASGGTPAGGIEPAGPVTFCCREDPYPGRDGQPG